MILTHQNNRFELRSSYAEFQEHGEKIKGARFRWDKPHKVWWTDNPDNARLLISCADDTARGMLQEVAEKKAQSLALSSAASADIEIPCPEGLAYMPFQRAGIAFVLHHFGLACYPSQTLKGGASPSLGVLIADEMG